MDTSIGGEMWLPVIGYESLYHVSNMGRVKGICKDIPGPNGGVIRYEENVLSPGCTWNGYLYVNLCNRGVRKTVTVHRLVAKHFVPNPDPKRFKIVDHKSGNKKDNRASELEWTSSAINNQRAYDLGLKVGAMLGRTGANSPFSKRVLQLSRNHEVCFAVYDSKTIAATKTGISSSCIGAAILGKRQFVAGGFKWEYVTPQ